MSKYLKFELLNNQPITASYTLLRPNYCNVLNDIDFVSRGSIEGNFSLLTLKFTEVEKKMIKTRR